MKSKCPIHFLLAICWSLMVTPLFAAPNWKFEGFTPSEKTLRKLEEKYPRFESASQAQLFLRDLSHQEALSEAIVEHRGDEWVIHAKGALRIKTIDFRLVSRTFHTQLDNLSMDYLGQVDAPEIRESLKTSILRFLKDRGFPKATVKLTAQERSGGIRYRLRVDYGYPCLIESVFISFSVPRNIDVNIEPGDVCDRDKLDEAVRDLIDQLQDEGYNQVRVDQQRFVYNTKSNTASVSIVGELGKKLRYEIDDKDDKFFLTDLFSADELEDLDPSVIGPEAMASDIKRRYQNRGYDDVNVNGPKIIEEKNDVVIYRFEVEPGPRYQLTNVQFQGATIFSRSQLLEMIGLDSIFQTTPALNPEELQQGIDNLRSKYLAKGFWDIDIKEPRITKNRENETAQAYILIEEGMQRKFAGANISGGGAIQANKIRKLIKLEEGEPFDQSKISDFENDARALYVSDGYLFVDIIVQLNQRTGLKTIFVTINVRIDEGERAKIGDISVTGLSRTDAKVILRELQFETGDWYDPNAIDTSRRALLSLGLFQSVLIIPADRNATAEKNPRIDMVIEIRESKPGNVSFGPGWSLYRGNRFGAESSYNNIGGVGRQVFARAQLSEEAQQKAIGDKTLIGRNLSIGYLEPYIFGLPFNATASTSNNARADDKWQLSTTGEVALTHNFRNFFTGSSVSTFYGQKINREESSEQERIGYLRLLGGSVRSGLIGLRYKWDHRNDITWPTSGFIFNVEASQARYAYGGNLAFRYSGISYSHYLGLFGDRTVIAAGFSLDSYRSVDRKGGEADMLPQSETLYVGGAETVRGFRERTLGPIIAYDAFDEEGNFIGRDRDSYLGGSQSSVFKLEVRQRIYGDSLAMTTFVDTGSVFFRDEEISSFDGRETENATTEGKTPATVEDNVAYDFNELLEKPEYIWTRNYAAYGVGVNYLTPLGSINLSYGLPWKRCARDGDSCIERGEKAKHWILTGLFHINVGTNF